ncbi:MAG: PSD1 and planctomycete cytochrome C domain-containing protein [Fuerstiella sp.]
MFILHLLRLQHALPAQIRPLMVVGVLGLLCVCCTVSADERETLFESQIRPLLLDKCVACHGPSKQEAGLRLDSKEQVLTGTSDLPPLVNLTDAKASRLLQVMLYSDDDTQMPPKGKLPDEQIAAVKTWIEAGAYWPEHNDFGKAAAVNKDAWRQHWAFQPIADPPRPVIGDSSWHPIDAFVRHKLREQNIQPSPLATGRVLARRLSYAITGLPPQSSALQEIEGLTDPTAVATWVTQYIDQLLASPQYGERWGRYWLDASRYADTKGYVFQEDREYPEAWKYREWVINSLNNDMPYSEFLKRQIAADQLPGSDDPAQLAAMGFFTLGRRFLNNQQDIIDDRIDVLARGTMGLTVACARCHDHKFDPIPTADYYSLYGVFDSSDEPKNEPSTLRLVDRDKPREPVIFVRGSAGNRGEKVSRHFLTALSNGEPKPFANGSGRLELAEKIASNDNPLTARVAVNRVWMKLFGKGLVDSPSDFGVRTGPPSHPELLDHLTTWFIKNNWSQKALIRYIVLSHTWQQSSDARPEVAVNDPENRLLARMPRRRMDFEAFRDSLLAVAGKLEMQVGGTSADITSESLTLRRTVYARIDRQNLPNLFRTFDFASPDNHAAQRYETTVPQQALFQLNNPFVMSMAETLANSAVTAGKETGGNTVEALFKRVLQRSPSADEAEWADRFLATSAELIPSGDGIVGWSYLWGELNSDKTAMVKTEALPVFHEQRWSGGEKHPDAALGWTMLTRDGGHTGHDLRHCPVRRWTADRDCSVRVTSIVEHGTDNGDGIHAHILHAGKSLGTVHVRNQNKPLATAIVPIRAGESIDFVADCGANESHDSFKWKVTIEQSVNDQRVRSWSSEKEFSGNAAATRMGAVQQLAQALLLTNEFMFVD